MPHTTRRQVLGAAAGTAAALGLNAVHADAAPPPAAASRRARERAEALVRRMTLEEKVGQLFVVEVYGQAADAPHPKNRELYGVDTPADVIEEYRPGGVIYFDARRGTDNLRTPRQTAALSNGLQRAALHSGARLPLLVATDQEGGSVVYRMPSPATQLPGNMALAASRSRTDTRRAAEITAVELASVGINQDYAPSADVNVNADNPVIGVRSFGSDPELCSQFVAASIRGFHRGGTAAAAKHFPGHGDTDTDSHTGLPVIHHSLDELNRIDLPPFRAAIAQGVDTVLSAHIVVPALDPAKRPATMSPPIITGLLREKLGFRGVIATDALDMSGATADFPPDVAPVRALQAGCDQLVLAPQLDTARKAVLKAVRDGTITRARLDASVVRLLTHKLRHGLFPRPYVQESRAERTVGKRRHLLDGSALTDRTITLVKNADDVLPLPTTRRSVLVTGWGTDQVDGVSAAIAARTDQYASPLSTGSAPDADQIAACVRAFADHDAVLVLTNAAVASDRGTAQAALVEALRKSAGTRPVIVAAVQNPYDIRHFPDAPTYLTTYSYTTPSLDSLVRTLYGDTPPTGRLPVPIPALDAPTRTLFPLGHGLRYS